MDKFHTHWDKLRIFHQVAQVGSFKGAAEILNISQPALSRSINILEEYLGMQLFERLPRGLSLTRQGEIINAALLKIIDELAEAQTQLEEEEFEPAGSIKIGAPAGLAAFYLSAMLPDFLEKYPKIHLTIYGTDTLPSLQTGEADAIISPFIEDDESLIQTLITRFHLKLYASLSYLETFGVPKTVSDLDHHRLLAYGNHKNSHPFSLANWHLAIGLKKGQIRRPFVIINSATGLVNMAKRGMGIATLSDEHPCLSGSNLVEVLPDMVSPPLETYFIYSGRTKKLKRMRLLEDFLLQSFKNRLLDRDEASS